LVVVATTPSIAADNAELVLVGGRVYTVNAAQPWASAVAIRDKHFVYLGDDVGSERFVGPSTRVVNLGGRMAMPGIHDAHAHLLISGLQNTVECRLPHGSGLSDVIGTLKACERRLGPGEWLVGGPITYTQFPNDTPHRSALDEAFPERPVYLDDDSLHHALGWEVRQGSIEIGNVANLIVLDRNVFEVPTDDIGGQRSC
jgi:predicted amidohydrolase YtcJ